MDRETHRQSVAVHNCPGQRLDTYSFVDIHTLCFRNICSGLQAIIAPPQLHLGTLDLLYSNDRTNTKKYQL